jgi:hypothetical protein
MGRTQRYDAARWLLWVLMKQRSNDDTAKAVSDQVHYRALQADQKSLQALRVLQKILANRRV